MLRDGVHPVIRDDVDVRFGPPPVWFHGRSCEGEEGEREWVEGELAKGTIEEFAGRVPHPWARVFPVRARGKKTRWVINYKRGLNRWTEIPRFRNVKLEEVAAATKKGDWGAVLDVRSAFKHIRIHPRARGWFAFFAGGRWWVPTVLPFGWSGSPWWWARVTRVVEGRLAEQGLRVIMYVDDILILAATRVEVQQAVETCRRVLGELGIVIAEDKATEPAQTVTYLGYTIDLRVNTWRVRPADRQEIRTRATRMLRARWVSRRDMAALLGKIQGRRMAIEWINAHTGRLYAWARRTKGPWKKGHGVPVEVRGELRYWAGLKAHQAQRVWVTDEARWAASSDASKRGWGVVLRDTRTGKVWRWAGHWTDSERNWHITTLEALAILRGVEVTGEVGVRDTLVRWRSDNKAAVATARNLRSRATRLQRVAQQLARAMLETGIRLQVSYIPGVLNGEADFESRGRLRGLVDHRLRRDVYRWLAWGRSIEVDMFASRASRLHSRYCSAQPDPQAMAVDAFTQRWAVMGSAWMHPPWVLIGTVIRKVEAEGACATVLVPRWRTATWWNEWWGTASEVWDLPRAPLLVHAGTKRILPPSRGTFMLGFFGDLTTWPRRRGRVIDALSRLLRGPITVWRRRGGRWTQT